MHANCCVRQKKFCGGRLPPQPVFSKSFQKEWLRSENLQEGNIILWRGWVKPPELSGKTGWLSCIISGFQDFSKEKYKARKLALWNVKKKLYLIKCSCEKIPTFSSWTILRKLEKIWPCLSERAKLYCRGTFLGEGGGKMYLNQCKGEKKVVIISGSLKKGGGAGNT